MAAISSSCGNNIEIYVDVENQSIVSCGNIGLNDIYITNDSVAEVYSLIWNTKTQEKASAKINLTEIDASYSIYKGWNKEQIHSSKFKLLPISSYLIKNNQSDVVSWDVRIWTDKTGRIIKSTQQCCSCK